MRADFELKTYSHKLWGIGFYTVLNSANQKMGMVGPIVMKVENNLPTEVELGFYLCKKAQGKSLGYDSLFLAGKYAFDKVKSINLAWGTALSNNLASQYIMLKGGLSYKGKKERKGGLPANYYEITRNDISNYDNNTKERTQNISTVLREILNS